MSTPPDQAQSTYAGEARISTVFALLPTSIQTRITPLRHMRRSISLGSLQTDGLTSDDDPNLCRPRSEGRIGPLQPSNERYDSAVTRDLQMVTMNGRVVQRQGLCEEEQLRSQSLVRRRFARQGKIRLRGREIG